MGSITKSKGQFLIVGGKPGTTFTDVNDLVNSFYESQMKKFTDTLPARMTKAAGDTIWSTTGVLNPIFGVKMNAQYYATDNTITAIGAVPYDHEGVRIATNSAYEEPIGTYTMRDGDIPPNGIALPIDQIRQPHKDLPVRWDYGLSLMELEGLDDTIAFQSYSDLMVSGYADRTDKDILRETTATMPLVPPSTGQETTLTPLSKIIASYDETLFPSAAMSASDILPYGGSAGDMNGKRSVSASTYNSTVIDAGGTFNVDAMKKAYYGAAAYWAGAANPNNKIWVMSMTAMQMIDAEKEAAQGRIVLGSSDVYVKWDGLNGVSTMPGMDAGGVVMRAYNKVPVISDNNTTWLDGSPGMFDSTVPGFVYLIDTDHLHYSMLTPITHRASDAYELTGNLRRTNVFLARGEMRCDKFTGHAKIVNG